MEGVLKTAREAVKGVHAAEFDSNGENVGEGRKAVGNCKKRATAAMRVSATQALRLAVRKIHFMKNKTRHLRAPLDCYKAFRRPHDTGSESRSTVRKITTELRIRDDFRELGIVVEGQSVE